MRVELEGEYSDETTNLGVSQGTTLGPIFFLCHLNCLPNAVK